MKNLKMPLCGLLLVSALFCWAPTCSAAETYQVTEAQLTTLEQTFSQLKQKQIEQEALLTLQKNQIETLKKQLMESQTAMNSSQESLTALNSSLTAANESLAKYAEEQKRAQDRLKQQRSIWAAVAAMAIGYALNK